MITEPHTDTRDRKNLSSWRTVADDYGGELSVRAYRRRVELRIEVSSEMAGFNSSTSVDLTRSDVRRLIDALRVLDESMEDDP